MRCLASGMATMDNINCMSSAYLVMGPVTKYFDQFLSVHPGTCPPMGTVSADGLWPYTPVNIVGNRSDPQISDPSPRMDPPHPNKAACIYNQTNSLLSNNKQTYILQNLKALGMNYFFVVFCIIVNLKQE